MKSGIADRGVVEQTDDETERKQSQIWKCCLCRQRKVSKEKQSNLEIDNKISPQNFFSSVAGIVDQIYDKAKENETKILDWASKSFKLNIANARLTRK